jgi:hypothetical protein
VSDSLCLRWSSRRSSSLPGQVMSDLVISLFHSPWSASNSETTTTILHLLIPVADQSRCSFQSSSFSYLNTVFECVVVCIDNSCSCMFSPTDVDSETRMLTRQTVMRMTIAIKIRNTRRRSRENKMRGKGRGRKEQVYIILVSFFQNQSCWEETRKSCRHFWSQGWCVL